MPRKIGNVTRDVLVNAALPAKTKTYTVISHSYAIDTILDALAKNGFTVSREEYKCTTDAKVAHGTFIINYDGDEDLGLTYSFSNSYDKSMRFRSAIGAHIYANDAYMVSNIDSWKRKHTGTSDIETKELINEHIENAQDYFGQLKTDKDAMLAVDINKGMFGSIIGELFILGYLGVDQLSVIAREYENPSFKYNTGKDNLWTCYMHVANALRQSHPSKWLQNQVAIHLFFVTKFSLTQFDEDDSTLENQTDSTESSQEQDNIFMDKSDLPDAKIGDVTVFNGADWKITGENDDDEGYWELEPVHPITVKEPVIPGIHDGVEVVPILPGFEPVSPVEAEEEVEVVDPAQTDLIEQIAEANAAQDVNPDVVAAEQAVAKVCDPEAEEKKLMMEAYNEDVEAGEYPDAKPVEEMTHAEQYENAVEDDTDAPFLEVPSANIPAKEMPADVKDAIETFDPQPEPEVTAQSNQEADPDHLYFAREDYEGVQVGDAIEVNDVYYEIVGSEEMEGGGDYWKCKEIHLDADASTEEPVAHVETDTEYQERVASIEGEPEQELEMTTEEGAATDAEAVSLPDPGAGLPDIAPAPHLTARNIMSTPLENAEPVVVDEIEAVAQTEPQEIPDNLSEDNSPIKQTIAHELEELYGEPQNFTYKLSGNQYNIVLESGESLVLSAAYIESIS